VTTMELAPQPRASHARLRDGTLDRAQPLTTVAPMSVEDQLRKQDWKLLTKHLTGFAFKRTGRRSMALAKDLAQEAITRAFTDVEGWDPNKEPLLKNLCRRVIGLASGDMRRRRNALECELDDEVEENADDGKETPDELLDKKRYSDLFRRRLGQRLAGDEPAMMLVTLQAEGIDAVADQASASGLTVEEVREARRRVYYQSDKTTEELARELVDESVEEEVDQ